MGKAKLPEQIQEAMKEQGIKNLQQLAKLTGYGNQPMSIHRVFKGNYKHRSLIAYKKVADALEWSLDQFFFIADGNDPQAVANFIAARLRQINKSSYQFEKEVSKRGTQGGWFDYISGDIKYNRLRIYNSIKKALGITADTLYESLVIENSLTDLSAIDRFEGESLSQT